MKENLSITRATMGRITGAVEAGMAVSFNTAKRITPLFWSKFMEKFYNK
jgi:hypothetical protein